MRCRTPRQTRRHTADPRNGPAQILVSVHLLLLRSFLCKLIYPIADATDVIVTSRLLRRSCSPSFLCGKIRQPQRYLRFRGSQKSRSLDLPHSPGTATSPHAGAFCGCAQFLGARTCYARCRVSGCGSGFAGHFILGGHPQVARGNLHLRH